MYVIHQAEDDLESVCHSSSKNNANALGPQRRNRKGGKGRPLKYANNVTSLDLRRWIKRYGFAGKKIYVSVKQDKLQYGIGSID